MSKEKKRCNKSIGSRKGSNFSNDSRLSAQKRYMNEKRFMIPARQGSIGATEKLRSRQEQAEAEAAELSNIVDPITSSIHERKTKTGFASGKLASYGHSTEPKVAWELIGSGLQIPSSSDTPSKKASAAKERLMAI